MLTFRRLTIALLAAAALAAGACALDTSGRAGPSIGAPNAGSGGGGGTDGSGGAAAAGGMGGEAGAGGAAGAGGGGGGAGAAGAGGEAGGPTIAVAGELLVALDVQDPSGGTATWANQGTLGDFTALGEPSRGTFGLAQAVYFDGINDAYVGPPSVPTIEGADDRTIEVWLVNPGVDSREETIVAWSDRGGPAGTMMSFNYGTDGAFGAVTHWSAADLGWGAGGPPSAGIWHHLAYTYDGTTARVYEDGVERSAEAVALQTKAGFSINVAAQRNAGTIQFIDEFFDTQQAGSLWVAVVRVHSGALTPAEVRANFEAESPRFR